MGVMTKTTPLQGHRTKVAKEDQATATLKLMVILELTAIRELTAVLGVQSIRGVKAVGQSATRHLQVTTMETVAMVAMEGMVKMARMARMAKITVDVTPTERMAMGIETQS